MRDVALRVAWLRATAAARKRKMADEANSKKQVRRERGQSIFAVQPKPPMGPSQMGHPIAASMGFSGIPAANMGIASGMAMPAPNVMPPNGAAQPLCTQKTAFCYPAEGASEFKVPLSLPLDCLFWVVLLLLEYCLP